MIRSASPQRDTSTSSRDLDSESFSFVQNANLFEDHGDAVPLSWKLWTTPDPYKYALPKKGDHWEEVMKRVEQHDDGVCKGWREDIDTLLVFAGLFSAAVTAFLIESYKWLQPGSTGSANLELLQQISLLLQKTNTPVVPLGERDTDASSSASVFSPTPLSIRVNIFWFSSLTLSLSTAIIGILSKQWLREYRSASPTLSPKDALMLRQLRLESFEKWRVGGILSSLPLLLQAALVLFFAGLLDLLWSLNHVVALVLTCEVGIGMVFLGMTTVVPSFMIVMQSQRPCAYKSVQAWIFYRVVSWVMHSTHRIIPWGSSVSSLSRQFTGTPTVAAKDWTTTDRASGRFTSRMEPTNDCLGKAMNWVYSEYRDSLSMASHTFHCLEELEEDMLAVAIGSPDYMPQDSEFAERQQKSRYLIYNMLLKDLPWSKERQMFAIELLVRDINSCERNHESAKAMYISCLYAELRFGYPMVNLDDELARQIIHTLRFYFQCTIDGPPASVTYNTIRDISYLFLCCWRDSSPPVRRYSLLCLDELERAINKLPDHASQVRYGFDFAWLIARAMEASSSSRPSSSNEKSNEKLTDTNGVYDLLVCSERFRRFLEFLDGFALAGATGDREEDKGEGTPVSGASVPMGWKEQKASLAMQAGLDADYFDRPAESSSPRCETRTKNFDAGS